MGGRTRRIETSPSSRAITVRLERIERHLAPPKAATHSGLRRWLADFDNFWLTRFMIGLGAWLFVLTVVTFVLELQNYRASENDRQQEREARRLGRISLAWETLLRPAAGNTGKGDALNLLLSEGADLTGVDLSCEGIGTWRDGVCIRSAILAGIDLRLAGTSGSFESIPDALSGVRFNETQIFDLRARSLALNRTFRDVRGRGWQIDELLGFGSPYEREYQSIGDFTCFECDIRAGEMGWNDFVRFEYSVVRGTTVLLGHDQQVNFEEKKYLKLQTVLDNPVRIIRPPVFSRSPDIIVPYFRSESDAFDAIEWDAYRMLEFCAGPEHYAALEFIGAAPKPKWPSEMDDTMPKGQRIWQSSKTEPDLTYRCGLRFDDVEIILRRVLADWSLAYEKGMLRILSTD